MAVNKVVYDEKTLIDLTSDSVTEESLLTGFTAHKADGTIIHGTLFEGYPDEIKLAVPILDSNGEPILDSDGNEIYGEIIYKKYRGGD